MILMACSCNGWSQSFSTTTHIPHHSNLFIIVKGSLSTTRSHQRISKEEVPHQHLNLTEASNSTAGAPPVTGSTLLRSLGNRVTSLSNNLQFTIELRLQGAPSGISTCREQQQRECRSWQDQVDEGNLSPASRFFLPALRMYKRQ
jgi:hypothetical protein